MTAARMTFWLPDVSEAKKNIVLLFVSGKKVNLDRQTTTCNTLPE